MSEDFKCETICTACSADFCTHPVKVRNVGGEDIPFDILLGNVIINSSQNPVLSAVKTMDQAQTAGCRNTAKRCPQKLYME